MGNIFARRVEDPSEHMSNKAKPIRKGAISNVIFSLGHEDPMYVAWSRVIFPSKLENSQRREKSFTRTVRPSEVLMPNEVHTYQVNGSLNVFVTSSGHRSIG